MIIDISDKKLLSEQVDERLRPRLVKEFGIRKKVKRKGIFERILFPKFVSELNPDIYNKAWNRLLFKIDRELYRNDNAINMEIINKLIDEVIFEMKKVVR